MTHSRPVPDKYATRQVSSSMNKDELIEKIHVNHRQLMRYLFYFEKNSDGVFVASDRPKFGAEEMLIPGVFEDWSLIILRSPPIAIMIGQNSTSAVGAKCTLVSI